MLEYQLYAIRNPTARERAGRSHGEQEPHRRLHHALAERTGEHLPIEVDDLAAIFGIASDGFSQPRLVDDDTPRVFEIFLNILIRGLQAIDNRPVQSMGSKRVCCVFVVLISRTDRSAHLQ